MITGDMEIRARVQRDPAFKHEDVRTRYAVVPDLVGDRYPSLEDEVIESEYLRAIELVHRIVEWAEKVIYA